ncbi:hypothetical protein [Streptodolium elevatio]|uniref:Uncharacterized protein n=1 Tax=Streptodolium elevatio TaxID=3157996 RepID=A0ABV3DJP5_9ACTN
MSDQPKWAWWVVGIVIPVAGIVVSIQLATNSGSDDDKAQSTNTALPAPAASGGGNPPPASNSAVPPAGSGPAKVLAGPTRITLSEDADYIDLDSPSPTAQPSGKGVDAFVGFNLPDLTLGPPRSGDVMAVAPSEGPDPTRDDCNQAIAKRGTSSSGELAQGMRLCIQTDEGHTAYLRITNAPTRKSVTFEATVWE